MSSPLNELYGVVCTSSTSCVARFWTIPSAPIGQFLRVTSRRECAHLIWTQLSG